MGGCVQGAGEAPHESAAGAGSGEGAAKQGDDVLVPMMRKGKTQSSTSARRQEAEKEIASAQMMAPVPSTRLPSASPEAPLTSAASVASRVVSLPTPLRGSSKKAAGWRRMASKACARSLRVSRSPSMVKMEMRLSTPTKAPEPSRMNQPR